MMWNWKVQSLGVIMLSAAAAMPAMGYGSYGRVDFTINTPFRLRKSDVVLPAGSYFLKEVGSDEAKTFGLYSDPMQPPLALFSTIPIYNEATMGTPDKTEIILESRVITKGQPAVIDGWQIPGTDGWEVTGVVANEKQIEARSMQMRASEQRGS